MVILSRSLLAWLVTAATVVPVVNGFVHPQARSFQSRLHAGEDAKILADYLRTDKPSQDGEMLKQMLQGVTEKQEMPKGVATNLEMAKSFMADVESQGGVGAMTGKYVQNVGDSLKQVPLNMKQLPQIDVKPINIATKPIQFTFEKPNLSFDQPNIDFDFNEMMDYFHVQEYAPLYLIVLGFLVKIIANNRDSVEATPISKDSKVLTREVKRAMTLEEELKSLTSQIKSMEEEKKSMEAEVSELKAQTNDLNVKLETALGATEKAIAAIQKIADIQDAAPIKSQLASVQKEEEAMSAQIEGQAMRIQEFETAKDSMQDNMEKMSLEAGGLATKIDKVKKAATKAAKASKKSPKGKKTVATKKKASKKVAKKKKTKVKKVAAPIVAKAKKKKVLKVKKVKKVVAAAPKPETPKPEPPKPEPVLVGDGGNPWSSLKKSTLERKTVKELKGYLSERGVSTDGKKKAELVAAVTAL